MTRTRKSASHIVYFIDTNSMTDYLYVSNCVTKRELDQVDREHCATKNLQIFAFVRNRPF